MSHNSGNFSGSCDQFLGNSLQRFKFNDLNDDSQKSLLRTLVTFLSELREEARIASMRFLIQIIRTAKTELAEQALNAFCDNVLSNNELYAITSAIGLKELIQDMTLEDKEPIVLLGKIFVNKLLSEAKRISVKESIRIKIFELFSNMLSKFGYAYTKSFDEIFESLCPQLKNSASIDLVQQTVNCVAAIAKHGNLAIFEKICKSLIESLGNPKKTILCRNCVMALQAVCAQSPIRFANYKYVPEVFKLVDQAIESHPEEALIEKSLVMYETFLKECGEDSHQFVTQMVNKALELLKNNNISLKVRHEAINLLQTAIKTQFGYLKTFHETVAPKLILLFNERNEDVRIGIYGTYFELLNQTKKVGIRDLETVYQPILREQLTSVVPICELQLKENSKSFISCLTLLKKFIEIIPNALAEPDALNHLNRIIPAVLYLMSNNTVESNINPKIEALQFLNIILQNHLPIHFAANLNDIIMEIETVIQDPFNEVKIEGFLFLRALMAVIRSSINDQFDDNVRPRVRTIYEMILRKLQLGDVFQEEAIISMSQMICSFSNVLRAADFAEVFRIFSERLNNEATRLTCLEALIQIIKTVNIDLSPLFPDAFLLLPTFLRQNFKQPLQDNRILILLGLIVRKYRQDLNNQINQALIDSLMIIFNESDPDNSIIALDVITSLVRHTENALVKEIPSKIFSIVIDSVCSPQTSPELLSALENFLMSICETSSLGLGFSELVKHLLGKIHNYKPSAAQDCINAAAKCVASLAVIDQQTAYREAQSMLKVIATTKAKEPELKSFYAVSTLGFIGLKKDLDEISLGNMEFKETIKEAMNFFAKDPEIDINFKDVISNCLGRIAAGNLSTPNKARSGDYLKHIVNTIDSLRMNKRNDQCLGSIMLNALKVCLFCAADSVAENFSHHETWDTLFKQCSSKNESTRDIIADCFSKIILMEPEEMLPKLVRNFTSSSNESKKRPVLFQAFISVISRFPRKEKKFFVAQLRASCLAAPILIQKFPVWR